MSLDERGKNSNDISNSAGDIPLNYDGIYTRSFARSHIVGAPPKSPNSNLGVPTLAPKNQCKNKSTIILNMPLESSY